jgi:hypothetical protein
VATPNYAYEKRQRELAKKRKKEEKAARKASGSPTPGQEGTDAPDGTRRADDAPPQDTPSAA